MFATLKFLCFVSWECVAGEEGCIASLLALYAPVCMTVQYACLQGFASCLCKLPGMFQNLFAGCVMYLLHTAAVCCVRAERPFGGIKRVSAVLLALLAAVHS